MKQNGSGNVYALLKVQEVVLMGFDKEDSFVSMATYDPELRTCRKLVRALVERAKRTVADIYFVCINVNNLS